MVNVHKRNKRTRARGGRTCGTGFRKKKKGHGNNGGHGWSGTGKRASQKQQKALMYANSMGFKKYFGKRGLTSAPTEKKRTEQINLGDIKANYFKKDGQKIELKKYKILGDGEGFSVEIYAKSATQSAIDKMTKAGGKIIISDKIKVEKTSNKSTNTEHVEKKIVDSKENKKPTTKKTAIKKVVEKK